MESITPNARLRIGYFLSEFPSLSQMFILREIEEIRRRGDLELSLFAFGGDSSGALPPQALELAKETAYFFGPLCPALVLGDLWRVCRAPLRSGRLFSRVVLGRYARLTRIRDMGLAQRVALAFRINRFIAEAGKRGVQHIHAHFAWFNCTVAIIVAECLGIPYSVTAHAQDIYFKPEDLAEKLASARFVVTCTEFNRGHIERQLGAAIAAKVRVNYHGICASEYGSAPQPGDGIGVLSVGRLVEMKGFEFLIQALAILRRRGRSIRCTIAGHGPQFERLTRLARELELEQSVSFPGFVPHERLRAMYAEHALFVLPSVTTEDGQRDGIPNVILEAMACGLPVVSTINSGIPEAVVDGETGLLVPPGDPDKLADAMERLCADAALRTRLAENGRRAVAAKFDLRRNVEDLCRIFKENVRVV